MKSARSRRGAVAFLAAVSLLMAGLGATGLVAGIRNLTQPTTCAGVVMGELDGCEVVPGRGRGDHEVQHYWPGGLMAGIAYAIPADRHLLSRDQMHHKARTDGVLGVLIGAAILVGITAWWWKVIRRWPRKRDYRV